MKDVLIVSKEVQDLKSSLQFSQADMDDLKSVKQNELNKLQQITSKIVTLESEMVSLSSKTDYLENQSR